MAFLKKLEYRVAKAVGAAARITATNAGGLLCKRPFSPNRGK
jgi:hypothetical protein